MEKERLTMTTITFTEKELKTIRNCVLDYDAMYGNEDTEWDFDDVEGMREAAGEVLNLIAGKLNIERIDYESDEDDEDYEDDEDEDNVCDDCGKYDCICEEDDERCENCNSFNTAFLCQKCNQRICQDCEDIHICEEDD